MKTMVTWIGLAGLLLCAGCGGQRTLEEVQSLEYQESREGKALVYPKGVDSPEQSSVYAVPALSADAAAKEYDVNELAQPPALFDRSGLLDEDEQEDEEADGGDEP